VPAPPKKLLAQTVVHQRYTSHSYPLLPPGLAQESRSQRGRYKTGPSAPIFRLIGGEIALPLRLRASTDHHRRHCGFQAAMELGMLGIGIVVTSPSHSAYEVSPPHPPVEPHPHQAGG
jgi:hypothetical protein